MKDSWEPILTAPEDLEVSEIDYINKTISCIQNTSDNAIIFSNIWGLPNEREEKSFIAINALIVGGDLYPPIEEAIYEKLMICKAYRNTILPNDLYPKEINCNRYPEIKYGKPVWEDKSHWNSFMSYNLPFAVLKVPDIVLIHGGAPHIREFLWQMDGRMRRNIGQCDPYPHLYILTEEGYKSCTFTELKDGMMILNAYDDERNAFYGSYAISEDEKLERIPDWHYDPFLIDDVKYYYTK
jgi:hypothetical protein